MALHYTRKHDEADEKTVPAEEFMNLALNNKRLPDEKRKIDKIETSVK